MAEVVSSFELLDPDKTCSSFNIDETVKRASEKASKGYNISASSDIAALANIEIYNYVTGKTDSRERIVEFLGQAIDLIKDCDTMKGRADRMRMVQNNLDEALVLIKEHYQTHCKTQSASAPTDITKILEKRAVSKPKQESASTRELLEALGVIAVFSAGICIGAILKPAAFAREIRDIAHEKLASAKRS